MSNEQKKQIDLPNFKERILDLVTRIYVKKGFTGQQIFELHWKDGILVDCYETVRSKVF